MIAEMLQGLFGGVGQGLQINQQQKQQEIQNQLRQRQQQMADEEAKRAAVMEAYKTLQPGQVVEPQAASQFKALGLGGLESQGGQIVKAKSPQDQLLELKYQEAQDEADKRRKRDSVLEEIHNEGSGFFTKPLIERLSRTRTAELPDDIAMLPDEKVQFSPTVAAAGLNNQGRISAAQISAAGRQGRNPYEGQNAAVQLEAAARRAADAAAKDPLGQIDKTIWMQTYQDFKNQIGSGQPAAGPAPKKAQIGKYTVEY